MVNDKWKLQPVWKVKRVNYIHTTKWKQNLDISVKILNNKKWMNKKWKIRNLETNHKKLCKTMKKDEIEFNKIGIKANDKPASTIKD